MGQQIGRKQFSMGLYGRAHRRKSAWTKGRAKIAFAKAQVRLAQAAMAQRDISVSELCKELGIERVTISLYRPKGRIGGLRKARSRDRMIANKNFFV